MSAATEPLLANPEALIVGRWYARRHRSNRHDLPFRVLQIEDRRADGTVVVSDWESIDAHAPAGGHRSITAEDLARELDGRTEQARPIRRGDVYACAHADGRRRATVIEVMPGGRLLLRLERRTEGRISIRMGEDLVRHVRTWRFIGRAACQDGVFDSAFSADD